MKKTRIMYNPTKLSKINEDESADKTPNKEVEKPKDKKDPEMEKILMEDAKIIAALIKKAKDNFKRFIDITDADNMADFSVMWKNNMKAFSLTKSPNTYKMFNSDYILTIKDNKIILMEGESVELELQLNKYNKDLFTDFKNFVAEYKNKVKETVENYKKNIETKQKQSERNEIKEKANKFLNSK